MKGRTVIVPPGEYRLTAPLVLEDVLLLGQSAGGWPADTNSGPVLKIEHTEEPALILGAGASVHGFEIEHPAHGSAGPPRSATFELTKTGPSITNVKIVNPWDGVVCSPAPNYNPGRLHVANVFMVNVGHVGMDIQYTFDVPTVENVEVWISDKNLQYQQTAFRFGHNDGLRASNLFAFGCDCGYEFYTSDDNLSFWGAMENCGTDLSNQAIRVHDASFLTISGGWHLVHHRGLVIDAPRARISVNGGNVKTNGGPALELKDVHQLNVTGLTCSRGSPNEFVLMDLQGAGALSITGCSLDSRAVGTGIRVGGAVQRGVITGNALGLFNRRTPGAQPPVGIELTSSAGDVVIDANAGTLPLGQPRPSLEDLFAAACRYATRYGHSGGYPNYKNETETDKMASFSVVLLKQETAEVRQATREELEGQIADTGTSLDVAEGKFMAANRWAVVQGFAGGFPILGTTGETFDVVCIAADKAVAQDVAASELDSDENLGPVELRLREVDGWAENQEKFGFPNFEQRETDGQLYFGAVILKKESAVRTETGLLAEMI